MRGALCALHALCTAPSALAAVVVCAALAGCEGREPKEDSRDVLSPRGSVPYPPELARLCPLEARWWNPADRAMPFVVAWTGGYVTRYVRTVDGWEENGGVHEARVSYRYFHGKRLTAPVIEWLRLGEGPSLVVARRQVGHRVHAIEPPMPWLVAPLEEGRTWSWEGTIDGVPATDVATVRAVPHWRGYDNLIGLEHVAKLGSRELKRLTLIAPGLGLVGEEGGFADEQGSETAWPAR